MKTFALLDQAGYVQQIITGTECEGTVEFDPAILDTRPSIYHRYHVERAAWEDPRALEERSRTTALEVADERNRRLAQTDWTQLPDVPEQTRAAWVEYRQALRDITAQSGYPFDVSWPSKPV
jgi:hypothetical protein